jgi:hypothetical protein
MVSARVLLRVTYARVFAMPAGCETTRVKLTVVSAPKRSTSVGVKTKDSTFGFSVAAFAEGATKTPPISKIATNNDLIFIAISLFYFYLRRIGDLNP